MSSAKEALTGTTHSKMPKLYNHKDIIKIGLGLKTLFFNLSFNYSFLSLFQHISYSYQLFYILNWKDHFFQLIKKKIISCRQNLSL